MYFVGDILYNKAIVPEGFKPETGAYGFDNGSLGISAFKVGVFG